MNKVIDKGFRSCCFVSTIVKHPVSVEKMSSLFIILKNCHFCYVIRSMNVALLINSLCSATAIR